MVAWFAGDFLLRVDYGRQDSDVAMLIGKLRKLQDKSLHRAYATRLTMGNDYHDASLSCAVRDHHCTKSDSDAK